MAAPDLTGPSSAALPDPTRQTNTNCQKHGLITLLPMKAKRGRGKLTGQEEAFVWSFYYVLLRHWPDRDQEPLKHGRLSLRLFAGAIQAGTKTAVQPPKRAAVPTTGSDCESQLSRVATCSFAGSKLVVCRPFNFTPRRHRAWVRGCVGAALGNRSESGTEWYRMPREEEKQEMFVAWGRAY